MVLLGADGLGLDNMTGSAGADTFAYTSLADSGTTGATRDLIQDFAEGIDKIEVSAIDAITGGIDDAFTFLGTATFTGTAGQLRYFLVNNAGVANDFTLIELDADGNVAADSQITLKASIRSQAMSSSCSAPMGSSRECEGRDSPLPGRNSSDGESILTTAMILGEVAAAIPSWRIRLLMAGRSCLATTTFSAGMTYRPLVNGFGTYSSLAAIGKGWVIEKAGVYQDIRP